jgi:hypothetical protein
MNMQAVGFLKPITALYFPPNIKPRIFAKRQCRIQGMGLGVLVTPVYNSRVKGIGFRMKGLRFKIQSLGFSV